MGEYAEAAKKALDHWSDTMATVFGSIQDGLALAGSARILPRYPDWRNFAETLGLISSRLNPQPGLQMELNDPTARNALREIRDYLEMLQEWAQAFQAALWACLIASIGSTANDAQARRRDGLKALGAIYQFDLNEPATVLARLRKLAQPQEPISKIAPEYASSWGLAPLVASGAKPVLDTSPPGDFVDDPAVLDQWLSRLDNDLAQFLNLPSASGAGSDWIDIELGFWSQWSWPSSGPVTREPGSEDASFLDLIYTVRHGGVPIAPLRGGNLSILQWSRILSLALRQNAILPPTPTMAAANNLEIPELGTFAAQEKSQRRQAVDLQKDIIVICPRSAQSRSSTWQPEKGVLALALVPPDLAVADQGAERAALLQTTLDDHTRSSATDGTEPLIKALKEASALSIVQFVEVDAAERSENRHAQVHVARPSLSYFHFGFDTEQKPDPYLERPQGIRDLMRLARERYSDLLPSSLAQRTNFWARLKFVLRRNQYAMGRMWNRVLQIFGIRSDERQRLGGP
jgi:hypothetical protein